MWLSKASATLHLVVVSQVQEALRLLITVQLSGFKNTGLFHFLTLQN